MYLLPPMSFTPFFLVMNRVVVSVDTYQNLVKSSISESFKVLKFRAIWQCTLFSINKKFLVQLECERCGIHALRTAQEIGIFDNVVNSAHNLEFALFSMINFSIYLFILKR